MVEQKYFSKDPANQICIEPLLIGPHGLCCFDQGMIKTKWPLFNRFTKRASLHLIK